MKLTQLVCVIFKYRTFFLTIFHYFLIAYMLAFFAADYFLASPHPIAPNGSHRGLEMGLKSAFLAIQLFKTPKILYIF